MSTQIAVRLPDETVSQLDALVAAGAVASRTELVAVAIQRELRRRAAERDASILRAKGADDDLDGLVDWVTGHFEIERD
ncbi:ribbon-helix-helix domain-containing protein [Microbacterium sp. A84]|uniref:ribbon-helix-helix domain-containing protein n=1 Tax=Microbacterium sp. A84 TaxID=3450715 RepID=UPI003F42A3F4